jgi:hypothetical protein
VRKSSVHAAPIVFKQFTVAALGFEIQWSGEEIAFSLGNLEWERG